VNRDNVLFSTIGLLVGFIAGYLMHETMAARQPAMAGTGVAAAGPANPHAGLGLDANGQPASGAPAAAPAAPGGGPQMAEINALRAAVEKNPNDSAAVLKLAHLNFDIANWQRAKELYEHYLTLAPKDADVLTDLGVCQRELGQFEPALALFDEARKMAPTHWQSRFNAVVVLAFDLKRYDATAPILAELEKLQPANEDVKRLSTEVASRRAAG
jgi:cytochrome c-type biogenesis protein CcmH/NrfG